jgi:tetrahydromethanopterin S-methyltransferase subunit B
MVNFFLLASAFLVTAYVSSLDRTPLLAVIAASTGVVITIAFARLETRTRELVKRGERALEALERLLATDLAVPELELVRRAERAPALTSYAKVLGLIHYSALVAFMLGVGVALVRAGL